MNSVDTTLYLVTNSEGRSKNAFLDIVAQACEGGVTLVQLREKELSGKEFYELALKVKDITDSFNVPLIINDRIDVAQAVDAAGVHLGQSDLPVAAARLMLGPSKIVGTSTKTLEQALLAVEAGANYLGVGAIFPTITKVVTVITSVDTLTEITQNVKIPVVAIGGLNAGNMEILKGSGVSGVAVVTAIMNSPNPKEAAAELRRMVEQLTIDS